MKEMESLQPDVVSDSVQAGDDPLGDVPQAADGNKSEGTFEMTQKNELSSSQD